MRWKLQSVPAAFDELPIGILEPLWRGDGAVFEYCSFLVATLIQGGKYLRGETAVLLKNLPHQFFTDIFATGKAGDLIQTGKFTQHEEHVLDWGLVLDHG